MCVKDYVLVNGFVMSIVLNKLVGYLNEVLFRDYVVVGFLGFKVYGVFNFLVIIVIIYGNGIIFEI